MFNMSGDESDGDDEFHNANVDVTNQGEDLGDNGNGDNDDGNVCIHT